MFYGIKTGPCKRTYEGGCLNWEQKLLKRHADRSYTVEQCYKLCSNDPNCKGFYMEKLTRDCQLFRAGCTKREDSTYDYYAMADCVTTGLFYFLSYTAINKVL